MHARFKIRRFSLVGAVCLALSLTTTVGAQKTPLKLNVELTAQGGVQFKAPKWSIAGPQKPDVAVLKNDKLKGQGAPLLLMLSVEKGPSSTPDWNVVRQNIVNAARENKASLKLSLKEDFTGLPGVSGKRMAGSLIEAQDILSVELIALHKDGRVATVTLVRSPSEVARHDLVGDVAASAVFSSKP